MISDNPYEDFYIMEDIFTCEKYMLFSPSISDILDEMQVITWFILIGYNRACWQSYGPIAAFTSFESDSEALAKQSGIDIETADDLIRSIRDNMDEMGQGVE